MTSQDALPKGRRYRLLNSLGGGGMGAVFRMMDRLTGEVVVLKRLASLAVQPIMPDACLALALEFQVLASLHHPRIIAIHYDFANKHSHFSQWIWAKRHGRLPTG